MVKTSTTYKVLHGTFSFTLVSFLACTLYIWLMKTPQDDKDTRRTKVIAGLVTFIAAYHYLMIMVSFRKAYKVVDGQVISSGQPFEDNYRYVDWILTVPLLLIELVYAAHHHKPDKDREKMHGQMIELSVASVLMIVLGYPGELNKTNKKARLMWWCLSMVPFVYIIVRIFQIIPWNTHDKELAAIRNLLIGIWAV